MEEPLKEPLSVAPERLMFVLDQLPPRKPAPESRGNGLKFVKENLQVRKMHLVFFSGNAQADLNEKMEIKEVAESVNGCLAILTL